MLRPDAQDRAVRDDAVVAVIEARRRDHDHLALGLRQAAFLFEQRVVVGEERPEFIGPMRPREEDVGNEASLLVPRDDAAAELRRQRVELGNWKTADRIHGGSVSDRMRPEGHENAKTRKKRSSWLLRTFVSFV